MATLQKIRNRAGILVAVVIGLALFSFILSDLFQSGSSLFQRSKMQVAEIDGESIQYPDFQKRIEELGEIYKLNNGGNQLDENSWFQVREQAWQNLVREIVMGETYKSLGIGVSSEELYDMVQGSNIHPIVQQIFMNPNTQQVDKNAIIRFLKNLETGATEEQRKYWLYLEKQISEDRTMAKYNNLVRKGLNVTNQEAKLGLEERNHSVSFNYVALNYNSVSDSAVNYSTSDLEKYYEEHKSEYEQPSTRKIEYVTFQVAPSAQDNEDARKWIEDIKTDFSTDPEVVTFVNSNSDVPFDGIWYKQSTISPNLASWIFDGNANVNDVYGPYFEDGAYKLARVYKIEMRPDSVDARHILLQVASAEELQSKQALADSLKAVIEKGGNFATLARLYSADQGSATNGGELGFFTYERMVQPFAEAAFNNKVNEVSVATSQFGIHVIQTTKRSSESRQVQVAVLDRKVTASDVTYQNIYANVSKFATENTTKAEFDAAIVAQKLTKKNAVLQENDQEIPGLQNPRGLIRAAFDSEVGDILKDFRESSIFELGDVFVIASLVEAHEAGIAPFADVRARVELSVIKEKKAEYLAEKASAKLSSSDLIVIAQSLNSEVKSVSNVNYASFSVPGLGNEPALLGTVGTLEKGKISKPVKGNNAVYIVQVTEKNNMADQNVAAEQQRLTQSLEYRIDYQAYDAIKKSADIVDRRSKFF